MREYKLVVIGPDGCEKSAITSMFVQQDISPEKYDPRIEDSYRKQVEIDGEQVMLEILDTAGKEQFSAMRDLYMKIGQGFMFVYSITSQATFNDLADLHDQLCRVKDEDDVPTVLVGSKCDLEDERVVGRDQGLNLVRQWGRHCSFIEVSARARVNVKEAFYQLVRLIQAKEGGAPERLELCMRVIQQRGQLHQRMVTIVMNGLPRAGKTTTKERLLGRILQLLEISPSTGVVEPSLKVTISELPRSSGMVSGSQWTVLSLDDESLNLVSAILQAAGDLKSKSRLASVLDHITRAFKGRPTNPSSSGASNHPPLSLSTNPQLEASEATAANVSVTLPDQLFDELLTKSWDKLHASLEDATTVHFIDTGGQPEFQEILPALLSGHSISMLLFKLHEKLKQRYQVEYVSPDGTKSQPYTASCTVEDVLFQSLATVACYGSDTTDPTLCGSVALLVGTHKDRATEDDIQAAERSLKEKVESAEYFEKNMVHYPFPSTLIFPLDNTQDRDVQTLRRVLEDIIHKRFPRLSLPAPWLLFEIALRKAGVKILTMKDCQKIAKCYGITSKKELKKALRFLHQMWMVRYYPDVKEVKNLIICDLQILFDAITNIIVHTFTFEKVGQAGTQKFKKTGKFSLQEFQQLATSKCSNDLLPPEKLVKLLEYLHILVPVHEAGHDEYFMPCVLQVEDLDDTAFHSLPYPPLIISFECGYSPVGVFSALIVYLLQQSQHKSSALKWKIPHGATLYRNKIDFRVGHDLDKVTMVAWPTYFEVQYDCSASKMHPPVHTVCSQIREDILNGLTVVIRSRNYTCKTTPLISFYCPRPQCTPTPHIAICEGKNPSVMECSSSKEPIGLLSSHFIWFGKDQTATSAQEQQTLSTPSSQVEEANSSPLQDGSATSECPTMIELIRFRGKSKRINIPQEIGIKYYQFGVLLLEDESGARVRTVIRKHREDAEEINLEIFEQWIAGKGKQPVTWGTLVEVLHDVELTELAKGIADVKLS